MTISDFVRSTVQPAVNSDISSDFHPNRRGDIPEAIPCASRSSARGITGKGYGTAAAGRCIIRLFAVVLLVVTLAAAQQKEIEVSTFYAKVYVAPSTNANFVGLIQKGERYPIIAVRDNWYNIRFKNVNGWIEFSQAKVIDPQAEAAAEAVAAEAPASTVTESAAGAESEETAAAPVESSTETDAVTPAAAGGTDGSVATGQSQRTQSSSSSMPASRSQQPRPASSPAPSSPRPVEKKESRIRSWFTQQNIPELPPVVNPNAVQEARILYFHVNFPSGVREYLDPEAPILGMTKRGQTLQVIGQGESWCKVVFADTLGWVETKTGKIIDPAAPPPLDYMKVGVLAGGICVVLIIIVVVVLRLRRQQPVILDEGGVRKRVLIVSRSSTIIQYTLTNGTTSLDRCFSEVGFDVSYVREGAAIKNCLQKEKPDIIMIDYQFDHSIIPFMEKVCSSLGIAESVTAITFNVPDSAALQPGKVLSSMVFLGTAFSDRDVFKLITPMLRSSRGEQQIQKSSHASALAGNIADGNLLEVLQFIEIGSKTGCLLVELDTPFAIICFKNGRINFAATSDKVTGRDAIFKVLELKTGKFRFVLDKKPKASNVNLSTLEILMEWTKTIDEAHVN